MQTVVAPMVLWLACAISGRRAPTSPERSRIDKASSSQRQDGADGKLRSLKMLAALFQASDLEVAFSLSSPGRRFPVASPATHVPHASALAELAAGRIRSQSGAHQWRRRAEPSMELATEDEIGSSNPGLVLRPSLPTESTWFDSGCMAMPVVLPPSVTGTGKWQCYYYGNAGSWAAGYKNFLPTGWTGLAESDDGIHWTKVVGKEEGGSVLAPTGNPDDWDGIHLGVGDVVRVSESELHMYYFGGSGEGVSMGPNRTAEGLRMRIGRARSLDGGMTWERMGMVLDFNEEEGLFASWPRIMMPERDSEEPLRMLYHAFNGRRWAAFQATSSDQGETWKRGGMVLGPGEQESWDGSGVGTRAVARMQSGDWVMVYEAVDGVGGAFGGKHRLGVARLEQGTGKWEKDSIMTGVPGGPILDPGVEPLASWTSQVIGTPYLVSMDDGSLRLYFCSKRNQGMNMSIGLVVSDTGDLSPSSWKSVLV
mmetsp:Transcript_56525/g.103803  ORF Transcript_56525/g.103803 Transcript_56525/m.103803 type:complete len:481 (+) Transcript_56525:87-1529(+)